MGDGNRSSTRVAFGDAVRLSKERTSDPDADGFDRYVGLDHIDPGDLKIRRWGDVADGTTFTNVFRPGQVLFGKRRAYQRKVAVADFHGVCSGDIYVLEPKTPTVLLPELLPFICQTDAFLDHAVGTSAGSLSPRTNWQSIGTFPLNLPPLDIQRHLARVSASIDALRNGLDELCRRAERLAAARLEKDFDAGSRHPHVPLAELSDRVGVGIASSVTHAYSKSGIPIIQNSNIRRGDIDFREGKYVTADFDRANSTKRLRSGDVVIARTGIPGAAAVIPANFVGGHTFTTLIISPDRSRLLPKTLELWINSYFGQAFFASRKAGGVQKNMNATVLRELSVPLIPLSDQENIVTVHAMFDRKTAAIRSRSRAVSALRIAALRHLASSIGNEPDV